MAREKISTTVDDQLIATARAARPGVEDERLLDEALAALCREWRDAVIDRQYEAYASVPLDSPDDWGDLESFLAGRRDQ